MMTRLSVLQDCSWLLPPMPTQARLHVRALRLECCSPEMKSGRITSLVVARLHRQSLEEVESAGRRNGGLYDIVDTFVRLPALRTFLHRSDEQSMADEETQRQRVASVARRVNKRPGPDRTLILLRGSEEVTRVSLRYTSGQWVAA